MDIDLRGHQAAVQSAGGIQNAVELWADPGGSASRWTAGQQTSWDAALDVRPKDPN